MLSQTSSDGIFSSTSYVDSYMDAAQDMPDDLQKLLSRMREYDTDCHRHVKEADRLMDLLLSLQEKEDNDMNQKNSAAISLKLQNLLITTQEIGDEKLQIVQQIQDMLENKTRQLEQDQKTSEVAKSEPVEPVREKQSEGSERKRVRRAPRHDVFVRTSLGPTSLEATSHTDVGETHYRMPSSSTSSHATPSSSNSLHNNSANAGANSSSYSAHKDPQEKQSHSNWSTPDKSSNPNPPGSSSAKKQSERRTEVDKKKYKRRKATTSNSNKQSGSNSPPNLPIDPDEPTYCLCDQVSYGEMIGCDNDLCPIEWFHFQCVSLTSKPKGKWYCPKCRGDRPTLMKPKAVFLKELEKYNREKEEKA